MRFVYENEPYCLNLIDTPGHVDFSYEVSRSLAACEGALLVVDASQGVEAQTLANVYLALENNLEIIPVLNKIDLPGAEPSRVAQEIEEIVGLDCSNAIHASAKEGIGITEILNAIVQKIPPPGDTAGRPLRALIFDSYYDPYRGVIVYFRVIDGTIKKGDRVLFMASGKGVEAQTLANVYLALENNLEIIPVLNKIDLPGAEPSRVAQEIEEIVGLDCSNAIHASAKEGIGITEILNAIVQKIPPPGDTAGRPLRALIFDSYYDPYRGVIVYFRVIDGTIKKGDRVLFMASGKDYYADELGVLSPNQLQVDQLYAGEVGFLSASIRSVADARVGDTITHFNRKAEQSLPGYKEATPMVFCGLFPVDADQFSELRDALEKLQLNDAALKFEPETSSAMGFGFRCGFLGLLHMEIVQERLEREYDLSLITTAPSVVYRVNCIDGEIVECSNPSLLPEPGKRRSIEEPFVKIELLTPKDYIGALMELAQDRRGIFKEMKYITENRASLIYELPLAEMVGDFFDQLKSRSKGYASMEYSFIGYTESDLIKLDILINGDRVEPLATIVHKDKAYSVGRALTQKLKELIPRQMFKVPIQATIGSKVIASEAISAIRKDVLAKCYGGDISRKKKLLKKQAEGKKRMKAIGKVDVPQEAFMAVLKLEKEVL
ncbi:translation factor guf1 -like, chloroplastic [Nicotiana attenuata]|uniref:Translation factor GUF1 homolog, mitochondrial n=1 Tax=Nicotiana attenuata TaxID=49451 RepID=A0A1J6IT30_NICAT|nr:translation factor guf1 -like, chloroplastic [Nicotiana attenuata]